MGRTTSRGCDPLCAFIPMLNTISPVVARGRQRSPPDLPALFAICSCSYASSPPLFVVAVVILCWLIIGPGYPRSCGAGWPSSLFLLGSALSCSLRCCCCCSFPSCISSTPDLQVVINVIRVNACSKLHSACPTLPLTLSLSVALLKYLALFL